MRKISFVILVVVLASFVGKAKAADLKTGKWKINANGHAGELNITAIDEKGNLNGTVYGQEILGFWDEVSKKLTFIRIPDPLNPSNFQIYTGYLFNNDQKYTLTGSFEAFAGTGATAQRILYGWYAQFDTETLGAWTFMVYLDADNNLEGAGIDDFLEMASVGSQNGVNIVVQIDRVNGHDASYGNWTGTRRFLIKSGDIPSVTPIQDLGEQNMGDPAVLQDFVEWSVMNYPAKHYALSIWDHGDGWRDLRKMMVREAQDARTRGEADVGVTRAISVDDTNGDKLYMKEVQQALETAIQRIKDRLGNSVKLDVVGFDACLMGMVEVAYAMRNIADYVVGSEELEPGDGWPYDTILSDLVAVPSISPGDFAKSIVTKYGNAYTHGITQASVDLTKLHDLVGKINNFSGKANTEWSNMKSARMNAMQYHQEGYPNLWGVDLWNFADNVYNQVTSADIKTAALELKNSISDFVTAEHHSPNMIGSHGIAIYFPPTRNEFNNDPDHSGYEESNTFMPVEFIMDHRWDNWLKDFYSNIP